MAHLTETPPPLDARRADAPPTLVAGDASSPRIRRTPAERRGGAPHAGRRADRTLRGDNIVTDVTPAFGRRHGVVTQPALARTQRRGRVSDTRLRAERGDSPPRQSCRSSTPAATDDYFSDGDRRAGTRSRTPSRAAFGWTNVDLPVQGKSVGAQEMGRVLDVGALVAGTVRRAGDRLRVTTQLVSTADGKVL